MASPLLKCSSTPKNFVKVSPSSNSALRFWYYPRISMKFPMRYENMATPPIKTKAPTDLSKLDLGVKSPKPTVESVVNPKYRPIIVFLCALFPLSS